MIQKRTFRHVGYFRISERRHTCDSVKELPKRRDTTINDFRSVGCLFNELRLHLFRDGFACNADRKQSFNKRRHRNQRTENKNQLVL